MGSVETCLQAESFFDLEAFSHRELFQNCRYVYDALKNIDSYLAKAPLGNIEIDLPPHVVLEFPEEISIGVGTVIEPGVLIRGPCIIGAFCEVRTGAYIRGHSIFGNHCVIGHTTEVKQSIFLDSAKAAHFAYVGDSILGNRANLGAGVKLANLKFDHSEVFVSIEGKRIGTSLKKFGAIIGDDCQLGCNAVTNPGTLFQKKAGCYPCLNVGGTIVYGHIIKSTNKRES